MWVATKWDFCWCGGGGGGGGGEVMFGPLLG